MKFTRNSSHVKNSITRSQVYTKWLFDSILRGINSGIYSFPNGTLNEKWENLRFHSNAIWNMKGGEYLK